MPATRATHYIMRPPVALSAVPAASTTETRSLRSRTSANPRASVIDTPAASGTLQRASVKSRRSISASPRTISAPAALSAAGKTVRQSSQRVMEPHRSLKSVFDFVAGGDNDSENSTDGDDERTQPPAKRVRRSQGDDSNTAKPAPAATKSIKQCNPALSSAPKKSTTKLVQPVDRRVRTRDGGHDDYCHACEFGGELICCAYCVHVYHLQCLKGVKVRDADQLSDDWECAHGGHHCTPRMKPEKEDIELPMQIETKKLTAKRSVTTLPALTVKDFAKASVSRSSACANATPRIPTAADGKATSVTAVKPSLTSYNPKSVDRTTHSEPAKPKNARRRNDPEWQPAAVQVDDSDSDDSEESDEAQTLTCRSRRSKKRKHSDPATADASEGEEQNEVGRKPGANPKLFARRSARLTPGTTAEPETEDVEAASDNDSSFEPRSLDECDDYCAVCGTAGLVLSCSRCVHSYHFLCLNSRQYLDVNAVPDRWQCRDSKLRCNAERTKPRKVDDVVSDHDRLSFKWLSRAKKVRGLRHYSAFERAGDRFELGTTVLIQREVGSDCASADGSGCASETNRDDLCEIEDLYEDLHGERLMTVRLYSWPEQTINGQQPSHHRQECFPTANTEDIPIDAIQCKALVLDEAAYMRREANGELDESVFLARLSYNDVTNQFRPIVKGEEKDWALNASLLFAPVTSTSTGDDIDSDRIDRASTSLQLSSLPSQLPCREHEHGVIHTFLTRALRTGSQAGTLYIAGVPGTGKTASVRQVINELKARVSRDCDIIDTDTDAVPPFQFIEMNGMKMPNSLYAYSYLYRALTGKHASPAKACQLLDQRFKTSSSRSAARPLTVLLIDEIDWMMTRNQSLLYQLSDWPTYRNSRLVLIAISNTINFPHLLHSRVQSRFNGQQLFFAPYSKQQIVTIVTQRLAQCGTNIFSENAIAMCAAKVAAVSGDVRRALSICRRAIEIQTSLNKKTGIPSAGTVALQSVQRAMLEMVGATQLEFARTLKTYEILVLSVLALHSDSHSGGEAMPYVQLLDSTLRLQSQYNVSPALDDCHFQQICHRLQAVRLIELASQSHGSAPALRSVRLLALTREDLAHAFEHHPIGKQILPQRL